MNTNTNTAIHTPTTSEEAPMGTTITTIHPADLRVGETVQRVGFEVETIVSIDAPRSAGLGHRGARWTVVVTQPSFVGQATRHFYDAEPIEVRLPGADAKAAEILAEMAW